MLSSCKQGLKDLDVDEIVELSSHDVSPKYISEVKKLGFKDFDVDDLVQLGSHGVSTKFIAELNNPELQGS